MTKMDKVNVVLVQVTTATAGDPVIGGDLETFRHKKTPDYDSTIKALRAAGFDRVDLDGELADEQNKRDDYAPD